MNASTLPVKNVTTALLLCIFFGPIGLLYASFWGGFIMIFLGLIVFSAQYLYPILLVWIFSCIWGVGAVEHHNRKIFNQLKT